MGKAIHIVCHTFHERLMVGSSRNVMNGLMQTAAQRHIDFLMPPANP